MLAQVCDKFNVLPTDDRVRKLTHFQIAEILWHDRDEHGGIIVKGRDEPTMEDLFRVKWRKWGLTEAEIDRKWEEFWFIEGERERLEKRGLSGGEIQRGVDEYTARIVANRKWGR